MKISLATSLHLNHGAMSLNHRPGDPIPLQTFVPVGLLSLKAAADRAALGVDIRVSEINGLINKGPALMPWRSQQTVFKDTTGVLANDDEFYDHIADAILEPDDKLVGLMTDADSLHHTVILAKYIKQRSPQTLVCLGGPAASPLSLPLLTTFPFIDLVVRGEGELTFVELLQTLQDRRKPIDVLGLTWRDGDRVIENAERKLVDNLDELPIPAFNAYDMAAGAPLYLDVGRGCPFQCRFCATAPFWNRKYRMKSIDRIVKEITFIRDQYGRHHLNFSHDIFTADREWTHHFCERLINDQLGITWTCSTRTDIIDPDLLAKMAVAGCVEIYYGIESGSSFIQKQIHKNLDLNWAREIVHATAAVGIRPVTGFIVGYPMETYQTLQDTLEKFFEFLQVGGYRAHLFTLCPFHESPMYQDHRHTLSHPAEYYELPLTLPTAILGEELKRKYPEIFSSTYRYATPELPAKLVDANEELSAQLVVLKSIWPLLLPHYDSPLDWYVRWVEWIESNNAKQRPGAPMPHHGDAHDLLKFIAEEIERLELSNSDIADLVHYETMKLEARQLLPPAPSNHRPPDKLDLHANAIVMRRCDYLATPFNYDLRTLLSGKRSDVSEATGEWWIIFAKTAGDEITTIQVGSKAKRILERVDEPCCVGDLIVSALTHNGSGAEPEFQETLQLIQGLINHGLLQEVN